MKIKNRMKKNKKKKKNEKEEDKNFQKHTINSEKQIICLLVNNQINQSRKSKKRVAKIKMIKIKKKRNKKNQKNLDVEEVNGIKLTMNLNKNFRCHLINLRSFNRKKKKRLKMTNSFQKNKNKRKQKNAEKGVGNGTKYIINQEMKFLYHLLKKRINPNKNKLKKLMIIKNLVITRNKENCKNEDEEEVNGIKHIMNSRKKF